MFALKIEPQTEKFEISNNLYVVRESSSYASLNKSQRLIFILTATLILFQILDGFLTAYAMSLFGTAYEGNAWLRQMMELIGYLPALILAKGSAIVVVCLIGSAAKSYSWIKYALGGVALVYAGFAIAPWCFILANPQLF